MHNTGELSQKKYLHVQSYKDSVFNLPVGLEIVAHKLMTISAFRTRRTVRRLRILIAKFVSLVAVILQCGLCITKKKVETFSLLNHTCLLDACVIHSGMSVIWFNCS